MRRGTTLALMAAWLAVAPVGPVHAAPFCRADEAPEFRFGLARLKAQLGSVMGDPVECEHADSPTGDTLQHTTTGLAYYRRATNAPAFTDGYRHWAWTASGLVAWEGTAVDPPGVVAAAGPPAGPSVAPPPRPEVLLDALLRTPFDAGELPAGFSAAGVLPGPLSEAARVHHAVGAVAVDVRGPDEDNFIGSWVYPTEADARGHFESPTIETFRPAGFTHPAQCFTAPLRRGDERYGGTGCIVLVGNVEVLAASILRGDTGRGNDGHAIALAQAGVAHLERVRGRASGPAH